MFGKLKFIGLYAASWLVVFAFARLLFLLYQYEQAARLSAAQLLLSFWYGLRMDLSMTAYLCIPVLLFLLLALLIPFFRRALPYTIYTGIIVVAVFLVAIADLETYKNWSFRLDATPLKYLSSPAEAAASVSHLPFVKLGLLFLLLAASAIFGFRRLLIYMQPLLAPLRYRVIEAVLILACAGLSVIAMRGGLQLAPMNQSAVYFSSNNFANHAAINAPWNFMQGVLTFNETARNPYAYLPRQRAKAVTDSLLASSFSPPPLSSVPNPNIILVIWESFTEKALHRQVEGKDVVPHFNRYRHEGVYFSNAYASGDRTDKGLSAILSGYPALPQNSVLRDIKRAATLPFLSRVLHEKGYATPFYYGGEPEFANIKSYLLQGGFSPIIEKRDFAKKDQNSKWGAHDGVVAQRLFKDIRAARQPFFATWLTLTSHEPFETPLAPVFAGKEETTLFLNSLHYTDRVLHHFIRQCKGEPWWRNTILIVIGDHGHRLPEGDSRDKDFRIPLLLMGGALARSPAVIGRVVSQVDLAATLAGPAVVPQKVFPFSRHLYDTTGREWAFFSFNDGWGFIQPANVLIFDNVGKRVIQERGTPASAEIEAGQALQQHIYQDFLDR